MCVPTQPLDKKKVNNIVGCYAGGLILKGGKATGTSRKNKKIASPFNLSRNFSSTVRAQATPATAAAVLATPEVRDAVAAQIRVAELYPQRYETVESHMANYLEFTKLSLENSLGLLTPAKENFFKILDATTKAQSVALRNQVHAARTAEGLPPLSNSFTTLIFIFQFNPKMRAA